MYGDMIGEMQRRLNSKEDVPDCLVKMLLETKDEEGLSSEDILMLAIAFAFGGVHSVRSLQAGVLRVDGKFIPDCWNYTVVPGIYGDPSRCRGRSASGNRSCSWPGTSSQ